MSGLYTFTALTAAVLVACVAWGQRTSSDVPIGVGICAGVLLLVSCVCSLGLSLESRTCDQKGDALGRETRFGIFTSCLVATDDGQMVPLENLRFNESGEVAR